MKVRGKWFLALGVLTVFGAVMMRGMVSARNTPEKPSIDQPTFAVRRGPLAISVTVSGTIKPQDQEILKCEVEGTTTILSIIPEGTEVKKGDLLIRLDSSRLEDLLVDQEVRVSNVEASLVNAKESLAVTKSQAESDIDTAKLEYQFAQEDLKNYVEGTYPQSLREAQARITLANGSAKRARDQFNGSKRLYEKNFITKTELDADEQQAIKADLDLELAKKDLELLTEFTHARTLAELQSKVKQSKMALERTQRRASADVMQAEAKLKATELEYNRQKEKLDKIRQQIEKTKIYAPIDGKVIYATSGRGGGGRHGPNIQPLEEGSVVRERQELIHLPTTGKFMCEATVHESSLSKVRVGLPVHIIVDALPGKTFWGKVSHIAPLPDATSFFMNPDLKLYPTDIQIESDTDGLRTGMSCRGEIVVAEYDDAVYVPVQAVVRENGIPTVYVFENGAFVPRKVDIGLDNNSMVHVVKGLDKNELVLLTPPLKKSKSSETGGSSQSLGMPADMSVPNPESSGLTDNQPASKTGAKMSQPDGRNKKGTNKGRGRAASSMSSDERAKRIKERMQNMTPEERQQFIKQMQERQRQKSGGGEPPSGGT